MTSSIQPQGFTEDYSIDELEAVDLNAKTTKGLALSQIRYIKTLVLDTNEAFGVAGNAFRTAMKNLVAIKQDVKKTNWVALTDSGVLNMSGRTARDLATAWETWVSDTDVPDHALAICSARVLAKVGRADSGRRTHAINKIKKGEGLSDKALNGILAKTKTPTRRILDDLLDQAQLVAQKKSDKEKLESYADIILENIRLKEENKDLLAANRELSRKVKLKS